MRLDSRLGRPPEAVTVWTDAEHALVLDVRSSQCVPIRFSGSAALIWEMLEMECTVGDLCAQLAEHYGLPAQEIFTEVLSFIDTLVGEGVLEVRGLGM